MLNPEAQGLGGLIQRKGRLMMSRRMWLAAGSVVAVLVAGSLLAGCGSSETTATGEVPAANSASEVATLEIKMGEFYFEPKDATAEAGPTKIEAPNEGSMEHELVLFKTDKDPAKLPTNANGEVDEEKLDEEAEEVGEISDVEPGDTGVKEFDLTPGKYVMFCNLPGHYAQGMYGTLTVTE